jgi:hypothetical protein
MSLNPVPELRVRRYSNGDIWIERGETPAQGGAIQVADYELGALARTLAAVYCDPLPEDPRSWADELQDEARTTAAAWWYLWD